VEVEFKGYRQLARRDVRVLHGLYIMRRYIELFGFSVFSPDAVRDACIGTPPQPPEVVARHYNDQS